MPPRAIARSSDVPSSSLVRPLTPPTLRNVLPAALKSSAAPGSTSPLALRSDLARATRGVIAFLGPLLAAQFIGSSVPHEFAFAAIAAQNIAFFEVRGDYRLRLAVLGCALIILTAAATLGAASSAPLALALAATALIAATTGLWRHLNPDYGPPLAISSMLVFLIAQETTPAFSLTHTTHTALWTLGGGLWGIVVQIVPWFFRPQQPLRAALADCWIAAAEFFEAIAENTSNVRHSHVSEKEAALRTALDKGYATLASARTRRAHGFIEKLERNAHDAARLSMRVGALQTALETTPPRANGVPLQSAFQPILVSLANHARTIALAVVSRQPAHLALVDVRLRRLLNLLEAFETGLDSNIPSDAHLASLSALVSEALRETETSLRTTLNRSAERAAFSLELTDTDTWSLRPLGAALNFSHRIDPVLARFTTRLVFLTVLATALAHTLALPHGYWLPFTLLVVLQPDYGATRARAAQRVAGTLLGSLLAIGLLALALPAPVLFALMTACMFAFGFFMKRNYSIGVLFVTIFVVLLTGLHQPVTASLAWERLASNALGGVLALVGALVFWPVWERARFPAILAASLRANLHYWEQIDTRLRAGRAFDDDIIKAKQRVEGANAAVFASLQRLMADPQNRQTGLEHTAALANGNLRLTRAFSVTALQLHPGQPFASPAHERFSARLTTTLTILAGAVEGVTETPDTLRACRRELTSSVATIEPAPVSDLTRHHALAHLRASLGTELAALLLAAESCQALGMFEDPDAPDEPPQEKPSPSASPTA
ncbi:hypothetical protein CMV30_05140 [Nibricoccus aquaticus]|uniref:Uncharacterized protein n=1 Tax=Nibricoccus aquaticus TaxID=2576891 RepID=A0A290Q537_9BACT|nr:FUSC family protein [Nibricoccus aquaticus]ATC63387.1 hypothetical protein CMV30_05140 [Nibricoccus aquaticus]